MKYETLTDVVQRSFATEHIKFDLVKTEGAKSDKKILSYLRGFIWRKYGIRIKFPLDAILLFTIQDAKNIAQDRETDKVESIIKIIKKFPMDNEWTTKEILDVIDKEYLLLI